jgi:FtsP/CotA-like multicopper oxidase with cupredoxin domain
MQPEALIHLADPNAAQNIPSIPEDIYYGCKPTEGEIEVIRPPEGLASSERWVAIDIIAATSFIRAAVSIDDHDMYVYAMDGSYIEPQKVQAVPFSNGDRYSVLVKVDKPGSFQIRVRSTTLAQMITAHAILLVDGPEDTPAAIQESSEQNGYINLTGKPTSPDVRMFNDSLAPPFPAMPIPQSADVFHYVHMFQAGATYLWALNGSRLMPADFEDVATPVLLNPDSQVRDNVTLTTRNGTWIDLVFTVRPKPRLTHPIHKHGNKMFILGSGVGPFKWDSVDQAVQANPQAFNLINPPRRDTFLTPMPQADGAWQVIRYQVTNPGAWLLHCHINNHMLGGMSLVIQDGIDAWPDIPTEYQS